MSEENLEKMAQDQSGEKSEEKPLTDPNQDAIINLATDLTKNENMIDLSSIMRMATDLLSNDLLMDSMKDFGKMQEVPIADAPIELPAYNPAEEENMLMVQLEKLTLELQEMKKELLEIKEQNHKLIKILDKKSDKKSKNK